MISEELGHNLKDVGIGDLGTAKKVTISKDHTSIIGGAGDQRTSTNVASKSKTKLRTVLLTMTKKNYKNAKSKLQGGTAVIYVGAKTEVKMKEKKYLLEDAIHAVRAAVVPTREDENSARVHVGGVLPGGGVALIHAAKTLTETDISKLNDAEQAGVKLVQRAVEGPLRQIVSNAGGESGVVVDRVKQSGRLHIWIRRSQ